MKFTATTRSVKGSSASRRLRRAGRVPAIVYGGKNDAVSIELDHNEIYHSLLKSEFHASVLDMNLDGKTEQVLLRNVQWHPFKPFVTHVDFQRIEKGVAITTTVPLSFLNEEESPAIKLENSSVSYVLTEVEISCLPKDLPSAIEVDLSEIHVGDVLTVADIKAPAGVEILTDAEYTMVTASEIREEVIEDDVEEVEDTEVEGGEEEQEEEPKEE